MRLMFDSVEEVKDFVNLIGLESKPIKEAAVKEKEGSIEEKIEEPPVNTTKETVVETSKDEAKEITLEDVRAVLTPVLKSGKRAEVKELLGSFGANSLTEVDPKDYTTLVEKAGEL